MNHFYFYDSIVHRTTDEIGMASWCGMLVGCEGKANFLWNFKLLKISKKFFHIQFLQNNSFIFKLFKIYEFLS